MVVSDLVYFMVAYIDIKELGIVFGAERENFLWLKGLKLNAKFGITLESEKWMKQKMIEYKLSRICSKFQPIFKPISWNLNSIL